MVKMRAFWHNLGGQNAVQGGHSNLVTKFKDIQGFSRIFLAKFKDICGVLAAYSVIFVKLYEENNHTYFQFSSCDASSALTYLSPIKV